ncbi:RHS repeat-associated core domain-containing protein [Chryseobacterium sp. MEBOG06]|nr:RHS repeat-associated core domain-containing protein [Chryseobacterium sp. MEBOG06]
MLEQRTGVYNNPYKFNAKELDRETGLYYYGARYYNPRASIWYGVDPLAVYNPVMESEFYGDGQHNGGVYNSGNLNPYIYCYQNPIVYVDPNGKQNYSSIISGKFSALGRAIDDGSKEVASQVTTRGFGAVQMVGGAVETVVGGIGGVLTSETGVGAALGYITAANGIDNTITGAKQLWTGESQDTYLHKGVVAGSKAAGASDDTAEKIATGADIATMGLGGGKTVKSSKNLEPMVDFKNVNKSGKWQLGTRATNTNKHLRLERHKIDGKMNTHINHGTQGKKHWPPLKK